MRRFSTVSDLMTSAPTHLGYSEWLQITQERIDAFAEVTGDHQWIHVDRERARHGPYGKTIAHGMLVLSIGSMLEAQLYEVAQYQRVVNYGSNRVRFINPVPVDSEVRIGAELTEAIQQSEAVRVTMRQTTQIKGSTTPACVADVIALYYA